MSESTHRSPIERFLGAEALRAGPFGLLRLTPETCTDERILSSLEWQLDRVAQHVEGDTPEADEVRLALHAAAAQLLDPNVRRHVLHSLRERGESAAPAPSAAAPPAPGATTQAARLTGLEQDALRTLAAYGGWNKQSLERLKALAYARGMGSREVALTLQNLATRRRRPAEQKAARPARAASSEGATPGASRAGGARHAVAGDEPTAPIPFADPGARYVRNVILASAGVVFALVTIVVVGAIVLTSGGGSTPTPPPPSQAGPVAPAAVASNSPSDKTEHRTETAPTADTSALPTKTSKPAAADPGVIDPQALVRALAECAAQAHKEPEAAAERFLPLARTLSSRWCRLDQSQRRVADVSVMDMVFATAGYPEVSTRVLDAVREGASRLAGSDALLPEETWAAAWSVGIMTRLGRERELSHGVSNVIDTELTAAIGPDRPRTGATFEAGALAALRRIPERLLAGKPPDAKQNAGRKPDELIRPWIDAVSSTVGNDADLKERMLVDALQRILTVSAEPSDDQRVFDAVQTLVTEIKWRKGGPARSRLLDWFKDPRVSMQDLQVVTGALASRSSAEGVDAMMVLSVGAAPSDRQRLRGAYAKAWGIAESVGEDKAAAEWLRTGKQELARSTEKLRAPDLLAEAVTLARLNEAAARLWRGESDKAAEIVSGVAQLPEGTYMTVTIPARKAMSQGAEGDGQWTVSYLSLGRNAALRQDKLTQMEKYTLSIGPVDAEELMYLACYESPADLRATAQRAVIKLANEAPIVNAALEILPRAPRYASVGSVFEQVAHRRLPRPTDASWELEARRALAARLLELLAAAGEDAKIDGLSLAMFDAYTVRAGGIGLGEADSTGESGATRGAEAAADLCRTWRAAAEAVAPNDYAPISLDVIDRRRQGRIRLAQGPVQAFAAQQVTTAELMAYVVSAEHPRLAAQTKSIMDEMADARRRSSHIFEQMVYTERAMLRLWQLRIAGDQP